MFLNRSEAGEQLAQDLLEYKGRDDVLVMALPRGGVPVAYEVARAIGAPLDILLVRKMGVPGHEELAMGAIASGGVRVLNTEVLRSYQIPKQVINQTAEHEQRELERREQEYRGNRPYPNLEGKIIILIENRWKDVLHQVGQKAFYMLVREKRAEDKFAAERGNRAIGVVYRPESERRGNYVPTQLPYRYDAFVFLDKTQALHPLHLQPQQERDIPELYPWGL